MRREPDIPFTQKGFDELKKERKKLLAERPQAVNNLREAREMGDLSENGYYKEARAKLSSIDGRVGRLDRLIRLAVVVKSRNTGRVEIDSKVFLKTGEKKVEFAIVGGYESDPNKGTISYRSPLGQALMGKKAGDMVKVEAPAGQREYSILKISG